MLDGLRHAPAGEGGEAVAIIHDTTMTPGKLSGTWRPPDGTQVRGVLATARTEPP